jgi:hypothetical protein
MTRALILAALVLLFAAPAVAQTSNLRTSNFEQSNIRTSNIQSSPVITPEWHERLVHGAIGAGMIAHFADLSGTEWGIGAGRLTEGNPLMKFATDRGPVPAAIAKGSLAVGSSYALIRLHRTHPKLALGLAIGQTVAISYVAYRNTRLLR